jgi:hypothetical protein
MTDTTEEMPTKREEMTDVEKKNMLSEIFGTKLVDDAFSIISKTERVVKSLDYDNRKLLIGQVEACHAEFGSAEHAFLKMACNNNKPSGPITSMKKGISKLMKIPYDSDFYTTNSTCILTTRGSDAWQYVYMLFIIESVSKRFPTFFFDNIWDECGGDMRKIDNTIKNISYNKALNLLVTRTRLFDRCTNEYLEILQTGKNEFELIKDHSKFEMDAIYSEKEDIAEEVNPIKSIKGDHKLSMASIYPQTSIYSQDDITSHEDNPIAKSSIPGRRTSGGRKKRKTRKMRKTLRKRRN